MAVVSKFQGILLLLLICSSSAATTVNKIFLNSYIDCGHDKAFGVNADKAYVITENVSPGTETKIYRDCETNVHAQKDEGHVCVVQEGKMNKINDPNAELIVRDGTGNDNDPIIFILKPWPGEWGQREYCTQSRFMNFFLHKFNKSIGVDIHKIYINLKVLDIESRDRKLYLDEKYCNGTYGLSGSQVSIFNRLPLKQDIPSRVLKNECSMKLKKMRENNMSICLAYIPTKHVDCSSNWTFSVSNETMKLYQLSCIEKQAKQVHAWCSTNHTHSLSLLFTRTGNISSSSLAELPEMFRFVFADYGSSPESFMEKVKKELAFDPGNGSGSAGWWIALIVLIIVVILAIALVTLVYRERHQLPCVRYKAVHNPQNSTPL